MLSRIELENFQTFSARESGRLAQVTLIFGPNSAGKSSLSRAIRFALENIKSTSRPSFSLPSLNLQSYKNTVHKHDESKNILLALEHSGPINQDLISGRKTTAEEAALFENKATCRSEFIITSDQSHVYVNSRSLSAFRPDGEGGRAELYFAQFHEHAVSPEKFDDYGPLEKLPAFAGLKQMTRHAPSVLSLEDLDEHLRKLPDSVPQDLRVSGELRKVIKREISIAQSTRDVAVQAIEMIRDRALFIQVSSGFRPQIEVNDSFEEFESNSDSRVLEKIIHNIGAEYNNFITRHLNALQSSSTFGFVGPLREIPKSLSREPLIPVGSKRASEWFAKLTEDRFSVGSFQLVNEELPWNIWANTVTDNRTDTISSFQDVGVGLSQIIPVLTSAFDRSQELCFFEQPELHLHPRMQGDLGDMFIEAAGLSEGANMAESSLSRRQFIIETHSENLILRIQRRIREGAIPANKISILYVDYEGDSGSTIKEVRLADDGEFVDSWPSSFVDLRLDDLLGPS